MPDTSIKKGRCLKNYLANQMPNDTLSAAFAYSQRENHPNY